MNQKVEGLFYFFGANLFMKIFNRIHRLSKWDRTMLNIFLGVVLFGLLFWMATQLDNEREKDVNNEIFGVQSACVPNAFCAIGNDECGEGTCIATSGGTCQGEVYCSSQNGNGEQACVDTDGCNRVPNSQGTCDCPADSRDDEICDNGIDDDADGDVDCEDTDCPACPVTCGNCDDSNDCTNDTCDTATGECIHTPVGVADKPCGPNEEGHCDGNGTCEIKNEDGKLPGVTCDNSGLCTKECADVSKPECFKPVNINSCVAYCAGGGACDSEGGDSDADGVCANLDCNDSNENIGAKQSAGTSCDDGDATTENDQIQSDGCTCAGEQIPICPSPALCTIGEFECVSVDSLERRECYEDTDGCPAWRAYSSCSQGTECLGAGSCMPLQAAACGPAARVYNENETGYDGAFCDVGEHIVAPVFPNPGESKTYYCRVKDNQGNTLSEDQCDVSRLGEVACTTNPCTANQVGDKECRVSLGLHSRRECIDDGGCYRRDHKESCGVGKVCNSATYICEDASNGCAEADKIDYYIDSDGDGYRGTESRRQCSPDAIYKFPVTTSIDCDDTNASITEEQNYYVDTDGDGHRGTESRKQCSPDTTYKHSVTTSIDCDDADASVGTNQNYFKDADGDGYRGTESRLQCFPDTVFKHPIGDPLDCDDTDSTKHTGDTCEGGGTIYCAQCSAPQRGSYNSGEEVTACGECTLRCGSGRVPSADGTECILEEKKYYGCNPTQCVENAACTAADVGVEGKNCYETINCDEVCESVSKKYYGCNPNQCVENAACTAADVGVEGKNCYETINCDNACEEQEPEDRYHFTCTNQGWTGPVEVDQSLCLTGESCNLVTGIGVKCCTQSSTTPSADFCPVREDVCNGVCGETSSTCFGTCDAGYTCTNTGTSQTPSFQCNQIVDVPDACAGLTEVTVEKNTPSCDTTGRAKLTATHPGGYGYAGTATKTYDTLAVNTPHTLTIDVPVTRLGYLVKTCHLSIEVTLSCEEVDACENVDCGSQSKTCSDGTVHACDNTCDEGTCQGCVLPDCEGDDSNNTTCEEVTCSQQKRTCSYGPDKFCNQTCDAGVCQSCIPEACDTAPCQDVWTPDPSTKCQGEQFTQTSQCGNSKIATGTKTCSSGCTVTTWTPSPSTVCSGLLFTQVSNCQTTKVATGTKSCSSGCTPVTRTPVIADVCSPNEFTQISNCGTTRVRTGTKVCNVYQRVVGDFGMCSKSCGGGEKIREYICKNTTSGSIVSNDHCEGTKPASETESCNTDACPLCNAGEMKICGINTGECSEGYEECIDGKRSGECKEFIMPDNEICDGKDNDCDGIIDEGVKNACGECGMVPVEICDGIDNDCDGSVDELGVCDVCQNGETVVCGSSTGECSQGKKTCRNGQWSVCEGEKRPEGEVCDNKDNDCDGERDEGLSCHRGGGGGGRSGGGNNYCGDGILSKSRGEECDDGNYVDGDGCSRNCMIEGGGMRCGDGRIQFARNEECDDGNTRNGDGCSSSCRKEGGVQQPPKKQPNFEESLGAALKKLRMACYYDDVDYKNIRFRDVEWKTRGEPADILRTYCIVKGYDKTDRSMYHGDQATSIAEAIKIVSKIDALYKSEFFDEYARYDGHLTYTDVRDNKWYAPYVGYAQEAGLLYKIPKKIGKLEVLKPLTPINKQQTHQLLDNAGVMESYRHQMGIGQYVKRENFAEIVVDAFSEIFADYTYIFGNNIDLYQSLYEQIKGKSESTQRSLIKKYITKLDSLDRDQMGSKFNIHVDGMIEFLGKVSRGEYDTTYGSIGKGIKSKDYMVRDYSALRDYLLLD